jgi:hypothetical protein
MSATGLTHLAVLIRRVDPLGGPPRLDWNGRILLPGLYLVTALLIAAAIIAFASRWRRSPRSGAVSASEQLTEFRSLYDKGQMSREEFERVRARLGGEIRGSELALPSPAKLEPKPESATADPPPAPPLAGRIADETPSDGIRPA